ncbi:MAG: hypothetical protein GXY67_10050 [Clostridiales bacterium]|nr:hypothetical protein [Clostridiales bacterium]
MNEAWLIVMLAALVISAALVVMMRDLLKACIGLALVSGILAVVMYMLGAHLAAVFELSVCAGLITVIFVSTISMTKVLTKQEAEERERKRRKRFRYLPIALLLVLALCLSVLLPFLNGPLTRLLPVLDPESAGKEMIWNLRQTDLLAQICIVLVGVYGVLIFFKKEGAEK